MGDITVIGLKEINQKIAKMERSLEDISKSLELIAKIMNRQEPVKLVTGFDPIPINGMDIHLEEAGNDDE